MHFQNFSCLIVFSFCLAFSACTYENEEELFLNEVSSNNSIESTDSNNVVSFSQRVKPILSQNCNSSGCHGAGAGAGRGNFTDYQGVKRKVDNGSFERRVLVQQNMPPNSRAPLSQAELNDIRSWINAGAPNN